MNYSEEQAAIIHDNVCTALARIELANDPTLRLLIEKLRAPRCAKELGERLVLDAIAEFAQNFCIPEAALSPLPEASDVLAVDSERS